MSLRMTALSPNGSQGIGCKLYTEAFKVLMERWSYELQRGLMGFKTGSSYSLFKSHSDRTATTRLTSTSCFPQMYPIET